VTDNANSTPSAAPEDAGTPETTSAASWPSYERWLAGGRRLALPRLGREVFVRLDGPAEGGVVTLLHGFPSSSHDWALVVPALAATHRVLTLDLLGFGDSDKPPGHRYSLFEQADLVEEVWQLLDLPVGPLVAHDYGVTVAQELLARGAHVEKVAWLNGGLYPALHRPTDVQHALLGPDGAALAAALTPELVAPGLRAVLGRQVPDTVLDDLAEAAARQDGLRNMHLLMGYVAERRAHAERWVGALEKAYDTGTPFLFAWGVRDPVSGGHMLQAVQDRMPHASYLVLDQAGHYPQLEEPQSVAAALAAFLGQGLPADGHLPRRE